MTSTDRRAVAFVFARGGSKGVVGKNLRIFEGEPLVARAVRVALEVPAIGRVVVSTDDAAIAEAARNAGADVPFMRPAELASDTAPEHLSWQHATREVQTRYGAFDVFVSVPPTAPLRTAADVAICIDAFVADDSADVAFTVTEATANPWFNMVKLDEAGHVDRLMGSTAYRRQDVPRAWEITPVAYVTTPDYVLRSNGLWDGTVLGVPVPRARAVDIDTELDLAYAQFLASRPDLMAEE